MWVAAAWTSNKTARLASTTTPGPPPALTAPLPFTGERFTPELRGAIWYEHWHRYCVTLFAARGQRVLDAACGEGYGSWLLATD
jgi:hypothetical protein